MVDDIGVRKIRLTGGEPTLRRDFADIVERFRILQEGRPKLSLGMTTNGLLIKKSLPALKEANITNLNFSLDTLIPAQFSLISRRPTKWYNRVRDGIDMAIRQGFNVKINVVAMRSFNCHEINDFMKVFIPRVDGSGIENLSETDQKTSRAILEARNPVEVRFIEFMPFLKNGWSENRMLPKKEMFDKIQSGFDDELEPVFVSMNETAQTWGAQCHYGKI